MENQELFKQAITDAKAVREAAISNAKAALEETFSSNIMSMLTQKINELEEDTDKEEMENEGKMAKEEGMETAIGYEAGHQKPEIEEEGYGEESKSMEEMELEEILAELEKEEEGKMEEGKKKSKDEDEKEELEETADADADDKMEEAKKDEVEEAKGDDEVTELTVDELRDIIKDVLKDVMGGEEEPAEEPAEEPTEEPAEDEKSIDLDELLAELAKDAEEEDKMEEGKKKEEESKDKKDLEEAIKTIKVLQSELNEVNLLNAKLLYTNKLFKAKSLSESQKVNVLKAFDRAENVKEAKKIYATLSESFTSKAATKTQIKESVGFASKASGVAPKQPIVESESAIRRMQQLAGIIK